MNELFHYNALKTEQLWPTSDVRQLHMMSSWDLRTRIFFPCEHEGQSQGLDFGQ